MGVLKERVGKEGVRAQRQQRKRAAGHKDSLGLLSEDRRFWQTGMQVRECTVNRVCAGDTGWAGVKVRREQSMCRGEDAP